MAEDKRDVTEAEVEQPKNYPKLLENYCSMNKLPSPSYTFIRSNRKPRGGGALWLCQVKVGIGNYSGTECPKKAEAKNTAAAVAYYACMRSGSVDGGLTKQQELKIFIDYQFAQAFQSLQQAHQACYNALGIKVVPVSEDE